MATLITKIQYCNFEKGEFTGEQQRTFEGTKDIIDGFPWAVQREHLKVDLTNPSVTIENGNGDYLKLALYYNGAFVLRFFNKERKLYARSLQHYNDAYPLIEQFFSTGTVAVSDFRSENTWLQHNLAHFTTGNFHYVINAEALRSFFWRTCDIIIVFGVVLLVMLFICSALAWSLTMLWLVLACVLTISGFNLILIANYYSYARDKELILSKGNDIFYFGQAGDPVAYNKKDILMVTERKAASSESPVDEFSILTIRFKDDRVIHIPNIFVGLFELINKFAGCPHEVKYGFPYLKRGERNA